MAKRLMIRVASALMVLAFANPSRSEAAFFTFNESVTGSGSLGSSTFTNSGITLSGVGNTANITSPQAGLFAIALVGQLTVAGVGSATITDNFLVFVNQNTLVAGFADTTVGRDTLDLTSTAFSSYGLTTAIGPVLGAVTFFDSGAQNPLGTTAGAFRISSVSGLATFSATPGSVPEPPSMVLSAIALTASTIGWHSTRKRPTTTLTV